MSGTKAKIKYIFLMVSQMRGITNVQLYSHKIGKIAYAELEVSPICSKGKGFINILLEM